MYDYIKHIKCEPVSEDCVKCNEQIDPTISLPSFFTGCKLRSPIVLVRMSKLQDCQHKLDVIITSYKVM